MNKPQTLPHIEETEHQIRNLESVRTLTESQKLATNPDISARVMANAGAGKTFVLTARVLRLLLKGVHPGKILCLTYTKAAAAEMRERISARLEKWALADDADLRFELAELIEGEPSKEQVKIARKLFSSTLESSPPPRIQTIHSFCQDVLKRFPLESGIQPYFEVADDVTAKELIRETTLQILSRRHEAVDYIAATAGEWKFNEVIGEIISQRNRIRDLFDGVESPQVIVDYIYAQHGLEKSAQMSDVFTGFFEFHPERLNAVRQLAQAMLKSDNANDTARGEKLLSALESRDFEEYAIIFLTKENEARKKIITNGGKKFLPEADEVAAYEQEMLIEVINKATLIENLEFTRHVISLSHAILAVYDDLKKSRALIDYNDLIYTTKKLLTTTNNAAWVLYKLDGGIDHILVDEAQDTSPDQWRIILALLDEFMAGEGAARGERTIFIVGDEKQSIYSFQGADQKKFNEMVEYIRQRCVEAGKPFSDLKLEISFRSVEAVLKLTDNTFQPEQLRKSISSSVKEISHIVNRKAEGGHVEIWPLIRNEDKPELENWQLPVKYHTAKSADLLLAEKISDTIADWLQSGRKLAATGKTVRPSDILILLRSRGNLADMLINRLKRKNIAVSGSDRLKITDHIAIQDLLALANFLLLPSDDLSLAAVLKSPLFGISEEELFELCYKREGSLWNNLKPSSITETLHRLLNAVDFVSVYDLYSLVLDQLDGRKKMIARLGSEVNDVLDEFLDLAVNFERAHTNSLQHFVHWVGLSKIEIKRDMEQGGQEQVRIMTVHGAKGLEAPIVFLADAAKLPKPQRQLVWNDTHFYSYKSKTRIFAGLRQAVEMAEAEDYDEYLRLLYVAITRARDELYICGSLGERNTNIEKSWYQILENSLTKFGIKDEASGIVRYETPHEKEISEFIPPKLKTKPALPEYMRKKIVVSRRLLEEIDEEIPFTDAAENIEYGNRVHKILEIAGQMNADIREEYLKTEEKLATLFSKPEFAEIFGKNSRAEVPIIGELSGKLVSGRIDRLVIKKDEIMIVDFKTSRRIPDIMPQNYIRQMDKYRQIIQMQYPDKKIGIYILWTNGPELVPLA